MKILVLDKVIASLNGILKKRGTARGRGQTDTKRMAIMETTDSYGEDRRLWKRLTVPEKTGNYGKV